MSSVQPGDVLDALRPIIDPDFGKSIVDLGFVKNLRVDGDAVSFAIELTTPACPVKAEFERAARERVSALPGVERVEVTMTANTRGRAAAGPAGPEGAVLPGVKNTIAVASGKGGVGKSTTAVNLALALKARGAKVGLLDADIYGPSQQIMLGIPESQQPEQKDGKYLLPIEAHGLATMSMGYLVSERTPMVWRGPMAGGALQQMLEQTWWGELDYLVIDMPPGTGDIQLTLSQKARVSGAVIVTTPQDIALLDARKGIEMFAKVGIPVLGIVENMAVHTCSKCGHQEHIFGAEGGERIAAEYGVQLLGALPLALSIREQTDGGRPTVVADPDSPEAASYLAIADRVAAALSGSAPAAGPEIVISND